MTRPTAFVYKNGIVLVRLLSIDFNPLILKEVSHSKLIHLSLQETMRMYPFFLNDLKASANMPPFNPLKTKFWECHNSLGKRERYVVKSSPHEIIYSCQFVVDTHAKSHRLLL